MHYLLTPVGSSGDVHPYLAIGRELRRRGHDVTLVAAEPFASGAEDAGCRFVSNWSAEEFHELANHPDLWHPRRGIQLVLGLAAREARRAYEQLEALYEPGRTVLVGHGLSFATRILEERHGVPAATIQLAPSVFRSLLDVAAPAPGRDISGWPRWVKQAMWWAVDRVMIDPAIGTAVNELRADVGLPPVQRVFRSWIHSPRMVLAMFPDWFARAQPDWPPQVRQLSFPRSDVGEGEPLDPALARFLDAGEPPLAFTPGSANRQAAFFFEAAVRAARSLGRRALLLTRYAEQLPADLPAGVRHVPYAPFSMLLPRCAALVHHGGIGTCAQGLAAGIPQLVMPMSFDQPDNATRLARIGAGTWLTPSAFRAGTRLASTLASLLDDPGVAQACARWREALARVDAIRLACDALEELTEPARAALATPSG